MTVSAYTDGSVTTNYYYVVTAVDTSGNESANSTEVSAIPANTVPPAPPTDLTAGDGSVILEWADNTEPDLAGYNVHRSTTSRWPLYPNRRGSDRQRLHGQRRDYQVLLRGHGGGHTGQRVC